jgi:hypothetical protein
MAEWKDKGHGGTPGKTSPNVILPTKIPYGLIWDQTWNSWAEQPATKRTSHDTDCKVMFTWRLILLVLQNAASKLLSKAVRAIGKNDWPVESFCNKISRQSGMTNVLIGHLAYFAWSHWRRNTPDTIITDFSSLYEMKLPSLLIVGVIIALKKRALRRLNGNRSDMMWWRSEMLSPLPEWNPGYPNHRYRCLKSCRWQRAFKKRVDICYSSALTPYHVSKALRIQTDERSLVAGWWGLRTLWSSFLCFTSLKTLRCSPNEVRVAAGGCQVVTSTSIPANRIVRRR